LVILAATGPDHSGERVNRGFPADVTNSPRPAPMVNAYLLPNKGRSRKSFKGRQIWQPFGSIKTESAETPMKWDKGETLTR
jgi:hypothetical protein